MEKARRKNSAIKVYCSEKERQRITELADTSGRSVSDYLRRVGMGAQVKSMIDQKAIKELAKTNADLGRAGGLLKMLLTNEERMLGYSGTRLKQMVSETVTDIAGLQKTMKRIAQALLKE